MVLFNHQREGNPPNQKGEQDGVLEHGSDGDHGRRDGRGRGVVGSRGRHGDPPVRLSGRASKKKKKKGELQCTSMKH